MTPDLPASAYSLGKDGAPGGSRTHDPLLRRQMLYPTELRAQPRSAYRGMWSGASDLEAAGMDPADPGAAIRSILGDSASLLFNRRVLKHQLIHPRIHALMRRAS